MCPCAVRRETSCFPFSSYTLTQHHNRSLLLQFTLDALFSVHLHLLQCSVSPRPTATRYLPYDWAIERGPWTKAEDYLTLLPDAFIDQPRKAKQGKKVFQHLLKELDKKQKDPQRTLSLLQEVYTIVESLFSSCQEDENLLLFLLKHQSQIDRLMGQGYLHALLLRLYPTGLRSLEEMVSDHYHERGFFSLIPELKELIATLEQT